MAMIFNTEDTKEEILKKINSSQGVTETIQTGLAFLNFKLQKELLEGQNEYNRKQLKWSRILALATIALVIATLLLVKFS